MLNDGALFQTSLQQKLSVALLVFAAAVWLPGTSQAGTATTTALRTNFNPTLFGQTATFTATVTPATAGAPTGNVAFSSDGGPSSSALLSAAGINGSVSAGGLHTCAVTNTGGARCWGANASGQLGDGSATERLSPVNVSGLGSGVIAISAGADFTCALMSTGGVKCWGHNNVGQLGDTTDVDSSIPVDVSGLSSGVIAISAGGMHACALTEAGAVKCWGDNSAGQLGDNSGAEQFSPVDVVGLNGGVSAISAGSSHTCALTNAGGALCWGSNAKGAIGDDTSTDRTTPVAVSGLSTGVSAIATGIDFTCAVAGTGVKCWGDNASKQLGDGTTTERTAPVSVIGLTGIASAIAVGGSHACVLNTGGAVQCWGKNSLGQLGNGEIAATSAPVFVTGYSTTGGFAVAAGSSHTCAVDSAAALFCWGDNAHGQIGDGSTNLADAPNDVTDFANGTMIIQYIAKLGVATLGVGNHTITAHYDGDAAFDPSDAAPLLQTVDIGATTTSVGPTPTAAKVGQSVTFHIVVSRVLPAVGTPGGNITIDFGDGGGITTVPLSGGVADPTHSYAAEGTYTVSVDYQGDANFDISGATIDVGVTKITSTLVLTATPNPAKPGQTVTFTARLTVSSGLPSGTVTFKEGATTLGSGPVSSRVATFQTGVLTIGTHTVRADYAGDAAFTASNGSTNAVVSAAVGAEGRVNSHTAGSQQSPAVAALASGYVVVWASNSQDGSDYGVYAQRYNSAGGKVGPEFRVNTVTAKFQGEPSVAALTNGFVVVWQSLAEDGSGLGVYAQRYTGVGAKVGGAFRVNTVTVNDQSKPSVAGLKGGGFVVAWQSFAQDGSGSGVYAQRYAANGSPVEVEFRVNTTTAQDQGNPSVAALTGGGFVIVWQAAGKDGSGLGIFAQRYAVNGARVGGEFRVNTVTASDQSLPSIAPTADGGFVVAWQSNLQDGSGLGVYAQRYTAAGARAGGPFRVNTKTANNQWQPAVASFTNGGFVIVWSSNGQDGAGHGIFGQAYNGNGSVANVEFRINTTTAADQMQPTVAAFANGNFVTAWTSQNQDNSREGIYAQRLLIPVTP